LDYWETPGGLGREILEERNYSQGLLTDTATTAEDHHPKIFHTIFGIGSGGN